MNQQRFKSTNLIAIMALVAVIGGFLVYHSLAATNPYDANRQATLINDPIRGLNYIGLRAIKAGANHPCHGQFEIAGVTGTNNQPLCTHGPDPAPLGVDVTKVTAQAALNQGMKRPDVVATSTQLASTPDYTQKYNDTNSGAFTNPYPQLAVPCTSGKYRIQLVLVSNVPVNSYTAIARSLMAKTAHQMEAQLEASAIYSGAGAANRHFRFVTDSACNPVISTIIVPTTTSLANPGDVDNAMKARGMTDQYTKYLAWDYGSSVNFCSTADRVSDSNPSVTANKSNTQVGYAEVGPACWGSTSEVHETMHLLGAVQNNAPHTSGGGHCIDLHDIMCYADGNLSAGTAVNGKHVYVDPHCTNTGYVWVLDCNRDDYFSTAADAYVNPFNYLYGHWNTANSPYLK